MAISKEIRRLRALAKQERLLRDRDAIRALREHFTGYDAKAGYSLDLKKIAQMPSHRRRALRKKFTKTQQLLATPHVVVKPKNERERKALRRETHQRMKGQKNFIVHVPDAKRSTVKVVGGQIRIETQLPGKAAVEERLFRFPRRPHSPDDMLDLLDEMLPVMPKSGEYYLQTDTYGDTGAIATHGSLRRQLRSYLNAYDKEKYGRHRFLNRVIGWRWVRSKLAGKIVKQQRREARDAAREDYARRRDEYRKQARLDLGICEHGRRVGTKCKLCPKGIARRAPT